MGKKPAIKVKVTAEERYDVSVLKASGMSDEAIALHKQITVEMLKASFAEDLEIGAASRRAEVYLSLHKKAREGVVSAVNLFVQLAEKAEIAEAQRKFTGGEPEESEPKLGKKELASLAAEDAVNDEGWGGLLN